MDVTQTSSRLKTACNQLQGCGTEFDPPPFSIRHNNVRPGAEIAQRHDIPEHMLPHPRKVGIGADLDTDKHLQGALETLLAA